VKGFTHESQSTREILPNSFQERGGRGEKGKGERYEGVEAPQSPRPNLLCEGKRRGEKGGEGKARKVRGKN